MLTIAGRVGLRQGPWDARRDHDRKQRRGGETRLHGGTGAVRRVIQQIAAAVHIPHYVAYYWGLYRLQPLGCIEIPLVATFALVPEVTFRARQASVAVGAGAASVEP